MWWFRVPLKFPARIPVAPVRAVTGRAPIPETPTRFHRGIYSTLEKTLKFKFIVEVYSSTTRGFANEYSTLAARTPERYPN